MKRTRFAVFSVILALLLLLTACGGQSDVPSDAEREAAMQAERELAAALSEAAQPPVDPGTLAAEAAATAQITASVDRADVLLYRDDTALVYTVETPADCTALTLSLVYRPLNVLDQMPTMSESERAAFDMLDAESLWAYHSPLRQKTFAPNDPDVTTSVSGDTLVWTVACDFGLTGAEEIAVEAALPSGNMPFTIVPVSIRYPEINAVDEFAEVLRAAMEYNKDEPYYFVCDMAKTSLDLSKVERADYAHALGFGMTRVAWMFDSETAAEGYAADAAYMADMEKRIGLTRGEYWDFMLSDPVVFGDGPFCRYPDEAQLTNTFATGTDVGTDRIPLAEMYVPQEATKVLCGVQLSNQDPMLPDADPAWLNIYINPAVRALVCEQAGVEVNADAFPAAAVVQKEMRAAIAACVTDGMTDFEKVKSIHDWMYERGRTGAFPDGFDELPQLRQLQYWQTAYGFLTCGFGDCMGWSDTFFLLCNLAGVTNIPFDCAAERGGAVSATNVDHRMNAVYLDSEPYLCDMYWDASGSGYTQPPYSNFLKTQEQAAENHTWVAELTDTQPVTATKYAVDPVTGELLQP